jgi:hypothetical protein
MRRSSCLYNTERPHRALRLTPPDSGGRAIAAPPTAIERRDFLGDLIHEYHPAAA